MWLYVPNVTSHWQQEEAAFKPLAEALRAFDDKPAADEHNCSLPADQCLLDDAVEAAAIPVRSQEGVNRG